MSLRSIETLPQHDHPGVWIDVLPVDALASVPPCSGRIIEHDAQARHRTSRPQPELDPGKPSRQPDARS
jgi:hypothetical protein